MIKPILFNTDMARAILNGAKTVTRRAVKPQPKKEVDKIALERFHKPYRPGDILYVRETWQYAYDLDGNEQPIEGTGRYLYAADDLPEPFGFWVNPDGTHRDSMPWRPSIHMPREAARIFLRVTDVRVERLWDITEEQAEREGCTAGRIEVTGGPWGVEDDPDEWTARESFMDIWGSTINPKDRGLYGWDANPWVWVIEFERCEKP